MALVTAGAGGRYKVEVKHNFGPGNLDLLDYLKQFDDSLRRKVLRKAVMDAGQALVKEVRSQIRRRDMPFSRLRGKTKKQLTAEGQKPLVYTIGKRYYSRPHRGLIGCVVGPVWPEGAHGHLAEHGHRITGKARLKIWLPTIRSRKLKFIRRKIGRRSVARMGERTIAHEFQKEAQENVEREVWTIMANSMSKALAKAGHKMKLTGD